MHHNSIKKLVAYSVISVFILSMSTNVFAGGSFITKWGKDNEPERHHVKHKHKHEKSYIYSTPHIKQFPPTDSKKKKNKWWSKVIFILLYEHATR